MPSVLAHGLTDAVLPIPLGIAQLGGVAAVAGLHAALSRRPTGSRTDARNEAEVNGVSIHPWAAGLVGVLLLGAIVGALLGPVDPAANAGSRLLWGLAPPLMLAAVILLGQRVRRLNPLRLIGRLLLPNAKDDDVELVRLTPAAARRAGVLLLGLLLWFELMLNDAHVAALIAAVFLVASAGASAVFGMEWFDRGDPIELSLTTVGLVRQPEPSASAVDRPTVHAVLAVLVGYTMVDSLSDSAVLQSLASPLGIAFSLFLTTALVWVLMRLAAPLAGLTIALVPAAVSYLVVHALAPLIIDSQVAVLQIASAVATLAGAPGSVLVEPVEFVTPTLLAIVAALSLLTGHVVAVRRAHRSILAVSPQQRSAALLQFTGLVAASLFVSLQLVLGV